MQNNTHKKLVIMSTNLIGHRVSTNQCQDSSVDWLNPFKDSPLASSVHINSLQNSSFRSLCMCLTAVKIHIHTLCFKKRSPCYIF